MKDYLITKTLREQVLTNYNNICQECKRSDLKLDIHHIVPREFGGTNDLNNLIPLCRSCHKKIEYQTKKYTKFNSYNPKSTTTINIKKSTYQRLLKLGSMGQTIDDVFKMILNNVEECRKIHSNR